MKTRPILISVALLLYDSGAVMAAENIPPEDKSNIKSSEVSVQVVGVLHEKEPVSVLRLI